MRKIVGSLFLVLAAVHAVVVCPSMQATSASLRPQACARQLRSWMCLFAKSPDVRIQNNFAGVGGPREADRNRRPGGRVLFAHNVKWMDFLVEKGLIDQEVHHRRRLQCPCFVGETGSQGKDNAGPGQAGEDSPWEAPRVSRRATMRSGHQEGWESKTAGRQARVGQGCSGMSDVRGQGRGDRLPSSTRRMPSRWRRT